MKSKRCICKDVNEAIDDERKGKAFYRALRRKANKAGVSKADQWKMTQASRDEDKHGRWMKTLKRKYCR